MRSMCIPTSAERSWMSARLPGITGSRARLAPSAVRAKKHTYPTGFSLVPPAGPADPRNGTAAAAPEGSSAPPRHRLRDLGRHGAVLFDQLRVDPEQVHLRFV